MKNLIMAIFSLMLLCGCGHNMVHVDRGTGMVLRIPAYDGYDLLEFKIGNIDSTTLILRGGSTCDSISSSGGSSIGTSGTSGRVFFNSIPQLNEGYLAKVLANENTPMEIKKLIVESYLPVAKPDVASVSKLVSIGSAAESGVKSENLEIKVSGMDNAVNKLAETSPKIAQNVADNTKEVATKIVDTVDVTSKITESTKIIKNAAMVFFLVFVMFVVTISVISLRKK